MEIIFPVLFILGLKTKLQLKYLKKYKK